MSIRYSTRQAIADLPGKTVRPWQDGDKRCHCTHCDLCGVLYRTEDISKHEEECQAALLAAISRSNTTVELDAWADKIDNLRWESWPDAGPNSAINLVNDRQVSVRVFYGADPDAAREAATKAIKAGEI